MLVLAPSIFDAAASWASDVLGGGPAVATYSQTPALEGAESGRRFRSIVAGDSEEVPATGAFDPRDFGAVGDGSSHTVSAALGVNTLAGLADYPGHGPAPYGFIKRYPYGVLFNLNPEQAAASGTTTLAFRTSGIVGVDIATTASASAGATSVTVGDRSVTADATPLGSGTPIVATGIAAGTTIAEVSGSPGNWTLVLSRATTAAVPAGALLTCLVQPASGTSSLPVLHTAGINRGDLVIGPGIPSGTQVDWVNHARMEIVLSEPIMARPAPGQRLTFTPSWLSSVEVGMQVQGPTGAVPAGTTVTAVDLSTGALTLSAALTGAVTPDTAMIGVEPRDRTSATPITFYRPYTDAEAAGLQMDRLGIQAAINAASAGGAVDLPSGTWQIDGTIVMPIFAPSGVDQPAVSLGGRTHGLNATILRPTTDLGPGNALISCGDPSGKSSNARGIYQGEAGYFCTGFLHDLRIRPAAYAFAYGLKPKWSGTPVAMDGIKQGPRLSWDEISVSGFDSGALAAMDHTHLSDSTLSNNFIGLRLDDQQPNLFGDEVFDRLYTPNNGWAGLSVSPKAFINAEMHKPYLASNPYAIYCEAGPGAGQCIQGTTILDANDENLGCGSIKDGGIQDGWVGSGGTRAINNLRVINSFELGRAGFGDSNVPMPIGGCQWAAYFDVGSASDVSIENVWTNDFAPVPNAVAAVLRVRRLDGFGALGQGGFHMSGDGVWRVIQNARDHGQDVVGGPNGRRGDFWSTGSWQDVTLEGPTFKARPMPLVDGAGASLRLGTLVEYASRGVGGVLGVQRAGQNPGAALAGVACQDWTANPSAEQIEPVICYGGSRVPLATTITAVPGQLLKASTTVFGSGVAASGITDGPAAGVSMSAAASRTLTYIKPLWAGQQ